MSLGPAPATPQAAASAAAAGADEQDAADFESPHSSPMSTDANAHRASPSPAREWLDGSQQADPKARPASKPVKQEPPAAS